MAKKRRTFEVGFKKQLIAQVESGQITAAEAGRAHNISPTVISYWKRQFQTGELCIGPTRREKALMREMEGYKRLLAEAHREIDLLKKQRDLTQERIKLNSSVITGLDLSPSSKPAGK